MYINTSDISSIGRTNLISYPPYVKGDTIKIPVVSKQSELATYRCQLRRTVDSVEYLTLMVSDGFISIPAEQSNILEPGTWYAEIEENLNGQITTLERIILHIAADITQVPSMIPDWSEEGSYIAGELTARRIFLRKADESLVEMLETIENAEVATLAANDAAALASLKAALAHEKAFLAAQETASTEMVRNAIILEEQARDLSETVRANAEQGRVTAETSRANNEAARGIAETGRSNAELGRTTAEQGRVTAETSRANNEAARGIAEQGRVTAETSRVNNETSRGTAETGRATAETGRVTAEQGRVAAEENRELIMSGYDERLTDVEEKSAQIESDVNILEATLENHDNRLLTAENKISRLYPYGQIFYGVERVRGAIDPAFTAIGNTDQHTSLPLHRMIRACKAGEDRKIRNYLNQTNWNYNEDGTPSVLDGSDGLDVMLHYPHMWAILDGGGSDGTKERWIISDGPFTYDGDVAIEIKSYLDSPDFCTLQSGVNKLRSVKNETASFAGSGSLATAGGLGYPRTVISRYNNEIYAGNKGAEWKAWYYRDHLVLAAFMYIEYKTKNLKSVFGGNLGHNWSSASWTAYNNIYPVRKIFETHLALSGTAAIISKGHLTGTWTKHFEFMNGETPVTYDTPFGVYRGKIMWGDMWKWMCGIEHEVQSDADGGVSNIWIQFNPALIDANRSDSSFLFKDTYTLVGTAPRVSGWSKSTNPKSKQSREVGGGETTYDCMSFYTSPPASGTARRGGLEGAPLNYGSTCAFGSSSPNYAPTNAYSHIGVGCRADVDE